MILAYLHPGKEDSNGNSIIKSCLPETQEFKVCILVWMTNQFTEFVVHFNCPIYIKRYTEQGNNDDCQIQNIPQTLEVGQLVLLDLKLFLKPWNYIQSLYKTLLTKVCRC